MADDRVKKGLELKREARRERLISRDFAATGLDSASAEFHEMEANRLEASAADLLKITGELTVGAGGEVVTGEYAQNTLARNPDAANIAASARRFDLVEEAGVEELALDAAQSIIEPTSMEKMLCHQLALAHEQIFTLTAQANLERDGVEKARLLNSAARFMRTYQDGMLCLNRIRTGGTQRVIVQHVQVNDGGQALVAGEVSHEGGGKNGWG